MNAPRWITRNGIREPVYPGARDDLTRDPQLTYESDLLDERIEAAQTGPWQEQADILATYMDEPFARLVAFVCKHWDQFACVRGEQRLQQDETFTGLAEDAAEHIEKLIESHFRSPWGRREYEPQYCEEE